MKEKDIVSSHLRALACGAGLPPERLQACPDDETFGAFVDGTLDEAASSLIHAHIAECPVCSTAFKAIKEADKVDAEVPTALIEDAKKMVAARPMEAVRKVGARAAGIVEKIAVGLLEGALKVLDLEGLRVTAGLEPSPEPVRSTGAATPPPGATAILEVASAIPQIDRVALQKIEPADVRITVKPAAVEVDRAGKLYRVDLFKDETLMQSWPLGPEVLAMEPVTLGRYALQVIELEAARGAAPDVIGTIDIRLES